MNSRSVDGLQRRSGSKKAQKLISSSQAVMVRRETKQPVKVSQSTIQSVRKVQKKKPVSEGSRIISVRQSTPTERDEHRQLEIQQNAEIKKAHQAEIERRRLLRQRVTEAELAEQASMHRQLGEPEERRELGMPDKKAQKKAKKQAKLFRRKQDLDNEDQLDHGDKAARDFLASAHDVNATEFDEIPAKEKRKSWKKKQKAARKAAKYDAKKYGKKKKHPVLKFILFLLLIALIGGGIYAYNYFNSIVKDVTGDGDLASLIFSDKKTPLAQDEHGRTNVLVFGTEGYNMNDPNYDGGYLTDSMMMVSFDQETGDIKAVSLPRDLHYGSCTGTGKLNEVFYCNYDTYDLDVNDPENVKAHEKAGQDALAEAFEEILGVQIHYKVHVNWQAVIQIIDAIGGIDVVFTYGEEHWDGDETAIEVSDPRGLSDAYGWEVFYEYPTMQVIHLDGGNALAVARTRNSHGGYGAMQGNFSREYFQQKIIEATIKKLKKDKSTYLTNFNAVTGLLNAVGDNLRTTFGATEIKTLMRLGTELNITEMETLSMVENYDGNAAMMTTGMLNGISYVLPTAGDRTWYMIHSFIQERLYASAFSQEKAQIVVLNGTETPGLAATKQEDMQYEGFKISMIGNTPDDFGEVPTTIIYKLTDSKPQTLDELKKYFGVEESGNAPESLAEFTEDADFIVVLGDDQFASAQ